MLNFLLQYDNFGTIDFLAVSIQRIAAKIMDIENAKYAKHKTAQSLILECHKIAVVGTLPPEFEEVKDIEKNHAIMFVDAIEEL
jgi:hypothetical protein